MRGRILLSITALSLLALTSLLGGCGSSSKEGADSALLTVQNAAKVGSDSCINTCHAATQDLTMKPGDTVATAAGGTVAATIPNAWTNSVHHISVNGFRTIGCEDCHGGGGLHWGQGPLAYPVPDYARCQTCHKPPYFDDPSVFIATAHANAHLTTAGAPFGPDSFFFQGGVGTSQASTRGVPEVVSGTTTPVTKNQHIEECSVCHNSNQKFRYDTAGNLTKPDPANMPNPTVSCASCHDAHQVGLPATVAARLDGSTSVNYPIFRKVQVNANGANDAVAGTWKRPMIRPDMTQPVNTGTALPNNRELNVEVLCASCHTVGTYKFGKSATHQTDVYSQWKNSAHSTRSDPPWAEFSADVQAYVNPNTGVNYLPTDLRHQTVYPVDMSKAGSFGNYICFKCHNGVGSIDYQRNVQGTAKASVVWGDEPATCITCHDPHKGTSSNHNVRTPVVMTNYSTQVKNGATVLGSIKMVDNVFLDNTPVPAAAESATSVICIFCHQGLESGLTLYRNKLAAGTNIVGNFFNSHYLGTGAMLWGANAYEYTGKSYSANAAHQSTNCVGCHMANPTANNQAGGHTWERNVASCNTSQCHGAFGAIPAVAGSVTPDLSTYRATFDTNNYTGDAGGATLGIATSIQSLQQKLITLLASQTPPAYYNDLKYPYFFSDAASTTSFTAWTPKTYKAAFNLGFIVKGLPSGTTSQANVPNGSAAVHNYKYTIQLLQDAIADLSGAPLAGAVRPAGTRPATFYGAGQ